MTAICEKGAQEVAQIPAPSTLAQLEEVVQRVRPLNDRLNQQVKTLTPPSKLRDTFNSLISLFDDDERALVELGEAAAARDQARANEAVTTYESIGREEDRLLEELGVPACTKIRLGRDSAA
jgi:hypothetical protein